MLSLHALLTLYTLHLCSAVATPGTVYTLVRQIGFWRLDSQQDVCLAVMQSIQALEQKNSCSADDVQAVLLWQEPMQTSKVFLGGMYILICLRQLVLGQYFSSCS